MKPEHSFKKLLHAPNVHIGGGFVLLRQLLLSKPFPFEWVQLDTRVRGTLTIPAEVKVHYVEPSLLSRLMGEWRLWRASRESAEILCFHGLPPLFPVLGRVTVFIQNRLLLEKTSLKEYPRRIRIRISIERFWSRILQRRCTHYVVQTPSMAAQLKKSLQRRVPVSVVAFAPCQATKSISEAPRMPTYDFIYVASGEPHKNHRTLLEAWQILALGGCKPSLALTLEESTFARFTEDFCNLNVVNLGWRSSEEIEQLYRSTRAMIFPSSMESFGLPLIEASRHGLPIVAAEKDYVRDVAIPTETFDPESAISIAKAVRRFLGVPDIPPTVVDAAEDFLAKIWQ